VQYDTINAQVSDVIPAVRALNPKANC